MCPQTQIIARLWLGWPIIAKHYLLTTDFIVDETLTLLQVRGQKSRALAWGAALFAGKLATLRFVTPDEFSEAWDVFQKYADKAWSFTDCTSKVVIENLKLTHAFSFDQHFRQFGTVTVVP